MSNTVSLAMIVKNEKSNIENLLDSTCPILEEVIIVDTGSTDGTLEILERKKKQYPNLIIEHFEWIKDFSAARNFAFSKATMSWVMWLDGDDLVGQEELKKFKDSFLDDSQVDCWTLDYIYSKYPNGDPQTILGRERFLRRSCSPTWVGAIHETISIWNMRQRHYVPLKVVHNQVGKVVDYNRNTDILKSEFEKNPNDPRTAYYYGKELFDRVDPKGLEILSHFVSLPSKYWDDEINARFRLACDDLVKGKYTEALHHAEAIYHLDSTRMRAEGYWIFGQVEQKQQNLQIAIKWYLRCLDGEPGSPRVINREYYSWNPMFRLSECYRDLGDIDQAVEWYDKVCQILPSNNSMVESLENSIFDKFFKDKPLKIVEEVSTRSDLQKAREDSILSYRIPIIRSHFGERKFDGLVIEGNHCNTKLVKYGGFIWSRKEVLSDELGYLGKAKYKGVELHNYIVSDPNLPKFIIPHGDMNFGPYRIRLDQLRKSLIKNGHPVIESNADFVVAQNLLPFQNNLETKILDVCEWLPESNYSNYGIEMADTIVCSSPLLSEFMSKKFPHKKVVCVEDHVDFTEQDWL